MSIEVGDKVKIVDVGQVYTNYMSWLTRDDNYVNMQDYLNHYQYGRKPDDLDCEWEVVYKAPHEYLYHKMIYFIDNGSECYMFGEDGLEMVSDDEKQTDIEVGDKVRITKADTYSTYLGWLDRYKSEISRSSLERWQYGRSVTEDDAECEWEVKCIGTHDVDPGVRVAFIDDGKRSFMVPLRCLEKFKHYLSLLEDRKTEETSCLPPLKWTDLKVGDKVKSKDEPFTYMVVGINRKNNPELGHVLFGSLWRSDRELAEKWEKVEELNDR